jgi:acyl-CoA synthetase (AMP-forming)/AMP-acid ligase II
VTNTGERLPSITIDRLRALFPQLDVFVMYGLTECKRVSILLPGELEARAGSVGRPLDGTTVEVVGKDGSVAPDGTLGELVVRGPHVTMGYWRNPEETARRFVTAADGTRLLFTGDICSRSADGYIYFEGRRDAQAKHRGFRISLREIESAALAVSGTTSAAVIASSDTDELHLFLTRQSSALNESIVLRKLRERLEPYKIPDQIHLVASLPTTPYGKVDQQKLCAWAEELRR